MAIKSPIQLIDSSPPDGPDLSFLWETSATQKFQIGQRVCLNNGSVFHYAYAESALTRQALCSTATPEATEIGNNVTCSGSTAAYAGAVGDLAIKVRASGAAFLENEFQGGQYVIASHTGSLSSTQVLWIKSHPAAAASAECIMQLYNPLQFTADSRCKGTLIKNPFYGVQTYDATPEAFPIGLAVCDVTATYYCWLQTWGPTGAIASAQMPLKGSNIVCGSVAGGVVSCIIAGNTTASYYPIIGFAGPDTGVSGCMMPIFLQLVP